jgi:deazaflavin-dependent oxidoreductase (nitroreductase family)
MLSDPESRTDPRRIVDAGNRNAMGGDGRLRRLAILGGPASRPIAGRRLFPLYGVLHHVGRRTGRTYDTPVVVRVTSEAVYVPLPFGERTDWYQNARAAGGSWVTWKGADHWLARPVVVDRGAAGSAFSRLMQQVMRVARIEQVVRFDPVSRSSPG